MMTFETDTQAGVVEFLVDGGVTRAEYDAGVVAMEAVIADKGTLSALAVIRNFSGMELGAWWKDVSWGATHMNKVRRAAIVTDSSWIEMMTKAGSMMVSAEVKLFKPDQIEAARAWVREG